MIRIELELNFILKITFKIQIFNKMESEENIYFFRNLKFNPKFHPTKNSTFQPQPEVDP